MLYIYKGYFKQCVKEKFCLFDEDSHTLEVFKSEDALVEYIIDNHSSEFNNLSSEIEPWISNILKDEYGLEISRGLTSVEIVFLIDRAKTLIY